MILEVRVLKSAVVVVLAGLGLLFFPWEAVVLALGVAYLVYKFRYYRTRVGVVQGDSNAVGPPGGSLAGAALGALALFVVVRIVLFPGFESVWSPDALAIPLLPLNDPATFVDLLVASTVAWAVLLVPLFALSYAVGQFRSRLLAGVDTREAAVRAALWEWLARTPVYVLWVGVFTVRPLSELWAPIPLTLAGGDPASIGGFTPFGGVLPTVEAVGYAVPLLIVGAYHAARRGKYEGQTVPEVLGYRGLYPPSNVLAPGNIAVPLAAFLLYAAAAFTHLQGLQRAIPFLVLPVAVVGVVAADVRGVTTRYADTDAGRLPGIAENTVVTGLTVGLYTLAAVLALGVLAGGGLDTALGTAFWFPVLAVPLAYGTSVASRLQKSRRVAALVEVSETSPEAIGEDDIDRLLDYVDDRDEEHQVRAMSVLATVAGETNYRQRDVAAVFTATVRTAGDRAATQADADAVGATSGLRPLLDRIGPLVGSVDQPVEAFARPALRGIANVLRADPDTETVERLCTPVVLAAVDAHLARPDPDLRALAADAFARIVVASYETDGVSPVSFDEFETIPIGRISAGVESDAASEDLTDAAVRCFAHLWEDRNTRLASAITDADEQRLAVALVTWAGRADRETREIAAAALTSEPVPVTDEADLASVLERLDDEDPSIRSMAAHLVGSSIGRHAARIPLERLVSMLADEDDAVRQEGARAIRAYVDSVSDGYEGLAPELIAHLASRDPGAADEAEAVVLRTLDAGDAGAVLSDPTAVETVAGYVDHDDPRVANPAAGLLARAFEADPSLGANATLTRTVESGLTHASETVREHCVAAATAVIATAPADGRPFVEGLIRNLETPGRVSEMAVSGLDRVLGEYPAYGTEALAELAGGLTNTTTVTDRYAGAMVEGMAVNEVTVKLVANATDHGVRGGEGLIPLLVDLGETADSSSLMWVLRALTNLSAEYPDAARDAVSVVTTALDEGNVRIRRDSAYVLANVAASHPDAVEPVVPQLVVAVDDDDAQVRGAALHAIGVVAEHDPEAVVSGLRRIVGRMDDDASVVRERAAEVVVAVANRRPELVELSAEASDRLRRLERDPAIDIDAEVLQTAANAIQTGRPPGDGDDDTDIWTLEEPAELGQSGNTQVFDPGTVGDDPGTVGDDPGTGHRTENGGSTLACPSCGADLGENEGEEPDECPDCGAELH